MASAIAADETQQCLSPRAEIWNRGDTFLKKNASAHIKTKNKRDLCPMCCIFPL